MPPGATDAKGLTATAVGVGGNEPGGVLANGGPKIEPGVWLGNGTTVD